jgi:hypothetical protein
MGISSSTTICKAPSREDMERGVEIIITTLLGTEVDINTSVDFALFKDQVPTWLLRFSWNQDLGWYVRLSKSDFVVNYQQGIYIGNNTFKFNAFNALNPHSGEYPKYSMISYTLSLTPTNRKAIMQGYWIGPLKATEFQIKRVSVDPIKND